LGAIGFVAVMVLNYSREDKWQDKWLLWGI
jgi:hypothetical protein